MQKFVEKAAQKIEKQDNNTEEKIVSIGPGAGRKGYKDLWSSLDKVSILRLVCFPILNMNWNVLKCQGISEMSDFGKYNFDECIRGVKALCIECESTFAIDCFPQACTFRFG